jgi:enoyl-CoA hydratase/carnithine racemase
MVSPFFSLQSEPDFFLLRLQSQDSTNRLTCRCVQALLQVIDSISTKPLPLVIAGNTSFFSAGAELKEIAALDAPTAYEFSKMGQELMNSIDHFPAPVYAAISGYCMGGGLDLALACDHRIASPHCIFGHRGAALGLMTGWGGTQRLPRLVGKARALQMFIAADKITAEQALRMGLVEAIAEDPVAEAVRRIRDKSTSTVR